MSTALPLRIALFGTGAMGRFLASHILADFNMRLVAWWDAAPASRASFALGFPEIADRGADPADWQAGSLTHILEAAHPSAVPQALDLARSLSCAAIIASVGGLISAEGEAALSAAQHAGTKVLVPSGAIGGLDLLRAIPRDKLKNVTLRTKKPPSALPPDQAAVITAPTRVFVGSAREAIAQFPKNVNVAVTLSLAGLGPDATTVEVWADPTITRNTHDIAIDATCGTYLISCANVPLMENPGTSAIAAMSILSLLRGESSTLRIGS